MRTQHEHGSFAPNARGFTLIELVIVVVMIAILSALAFPSMRSFIVRNRVRDAASDIFIVLNQARSEALKRNVTITLSPITAGSWLSGWHIVDPVTGGDLEAHQPLQAINMSMTGPANVRYQSTGRLTVAAAVAFNISASSGSYTASARVAIDPSGRPYITEML